MNKRPLLVLGSILILVILLTAACSAGFAAGNFLQTRNAAATNNPTIEQSAQPVQSNDQSADQQTGETTATTQSQPPMSRDELFGAFWQAWDLVHTQYVDQPVDDVALMRGAIKGMLAALDDQHTSYLDPADFEHSNAILQGQEYEGIGAWVDITGDYLTVISPMPGSPAEKAGLKPGDQVIAVDGEDMTGIDGEAVRQRILGPSGSDLTLTIQRAGVEEPFDVVLTRASIVTPSVTYEMKDNDIAYVRLLVFGDDTTKELRNALEELMAQNPKGLILDLRYNGGGYRDTAIEVASEFIGKGVIMYEEYGDGTKQSYDAVKGGVATDIPMVVLINEGSASASEIVAGAIQDSARGELVGVQSFGKGSVQIYTPLMDDQGAVRITVARWLTPDGRTIHKIGLTPDVVVELSDEDAQAGRDPQLDKAIEILMQK